MCDSFLGFAFGTPTAKKQPADQAPFPLPSPLASAGPSAGFRWGKLGGVSHHLFQFALNNSGNDWDSN
jgi:hypothetical protein